MRGRERSQEVERAATKGYARFAREVARGCERSRGVVGLFYASSARRVSRGVMMMMTMMMKTMMMMLVIDDV